MIPSTILPDTGVLQPRYKAVMENFCSLHEAGLLYRAKRLVNWCVRLNTTLSNLEVRRLSNRTG